MNKNPEKESLRKVLLEKRESTSSDLKKIASEQIHKNLKKVKEFSNAKRIASYYPIGSEVLTQNIMLDALSEGKEIFLPRVVGRDLVFRKVDNLKYLEKGPYGIMEPKEDSIKGETFDVILVPVVGISPNGRRLGYGYGYYDRFLKNSKGVTIALTYEKQIVKRIPFTEEDIAVDWIVTEDRRFKASSS